MVVRKARKKAPTEAQPARRHKLLAEEPYDIEDGVTYSLQSDFGDCRQRCRWALDGWRSEELKESLEFGSLMHRLLETAGKGVQTGVIKNPADAQMVFMNIAAEWMARHRDSGEASAHALQQSEFILAKTSPVWEHYCEVYAKDWRKGLWLDLEGKFDVQWRGYRLRGRRDGVRKDKRGRLWLFETKTKSQIKDEDIMTTLEFNPQALFYLLANRIELGASKRRDKTIVGVIYNVIRNPGERRLGKGSELLPDYTTRVRGNIAKDRPHYFKRYEAVYTKAQVDEFEERLHLKIGAFHRWVKGEDATYRNDGEGGACSKKWNCAFLKACASGGPETAGMVRRGRLFEELED